MPTPEQQNREVIDSKSKLAPPPFSSGTEIERQIVRSNTMLKSAFVAAFAGKL
jgi:hypothetical protein